MKCSFCNGTGEEPSSTGARLRALRTQRGLSQADVAKEIKVDRTTLCNVELDKADPGLKLAVRLALFYNVSLDWLIKEAN